MNTSDIRARILAVVVGVALLLFGAFVAPLWLEHSELLLLLFYISTYSTGAFFLGLIWPNSGWRLGGYLFAIWPLILTVNFLFSDPPKVIHWKEELTSLFLYLLILPGAMLGAWAGSLVRRSVSGKKSADIKTPLPRP